MTGVYIGCGIFLFVLMAFTLLLVAGAGRLERERRAATVQGEALRRALRDGRVQR